MVMVHRTGTECHKDAAWSDTHHHHAMRQGQGQGQGVLQEEEKVQ